ncbi:hypothetical protein SH580_06355 [Coraliomargarita algicola]|uniref:Uncharacterized protein n=1 Tax=Coraliomargarita algicola TaxID=3092156 RepID=A0ABZ0RQD7_9BACT|nr:hypothetical protein [Coraliomargarita sp. J2-16]WPJ97328.1 hypothetical protein SH580_06355 [Coraliomargarita sp. J2-16]
MKKNNYRRTFSANILLSESLSEVVSHLPPVDVIEKLKGEANYYGASSEVARQLGSVEQSASGARWEHGWKHGAVSTAEHIGGYQLKKRKSLHLVSTQKHEAILRSEGFSNVHAVGLPYLYADQPKLKRRKGSLLVCPGHTSTYSDQDWSKNAEEYAERIVEIKEGFSDVLVCLSANCIEREQWVHEFEAKGIPWVMGAWIYDRNALRRMRCLFSQFEFVTTNCVGSHIVYSSYEGCKISIWGWQDLYRPEDFINEPIYKDKEDFLADSLSWGTQAWMRAHYGQLFHESPQDAVVLKDWAAQQLGEAYKKPVEELADLFGWARSSRASSSAIEIDEFVDFSSSTTAKGKLERCLEFLRGDTRARLAKLDPSQSGIVSLEGIAFRCHAVGSLLRALDRLSRLYQWSRAHSKSINRAIFVGGSELELICCLRNCPGLELSYIGSNSIQADLLEANLVRFGYQKVDILRELPDLESRYCEHPSDLIEVDTGPLLPVLVQTKSLSERLNAQATNFLYVDLDLTSCQVVESSLAQSASVNFIWMHSRRLVPEDSTLVRLIESMKRWGFEFDDLSRSSIHGDGPSQYVYSAIRSQPSEASLGG